MKNSDNSQMFDQATSFLSNHRGDSGQGTLNRLFRKNIKNDQDLLNDAPELSPSNTKIIQETRPKLHFVGLAAHLETGNGRDSHGPLIIVRYRGQDRLIDGNHRCRFWYQNRSQGDHTAYVFEVHEIKQRPKDS